MKPSRFLFAHLWLVKQPTALANAVLAWAVYGIGLAIKYYEKKDCYYWETFVSL